MAYCHRQDDARVCGAVTVVAGQDFFRVEGKLWAVDGDPNSHGDGQLITSHAWLKINGKGVIVVGDNAAPDDLCLLVGGDHCDPVAVGYSDLVNVQ